MINKHKFHIPTFPVHSKNEPLSQKEITSLLIKTIQLYNKHKITLSDLVKLAENTYRKSNPSISQRLKNILSEISSFSNVHAVLNDILNELIEAEERI